VAMYCRQKIMPAFRARAIVACAAIVVPLQMRYISLWPPRHSDGMLAA
jgi:hypothetical protein